MDGLVNTRKVVLLVKLLHQHGPCLHQPGNAEMNDQSAPDTPGIVHHSPQNDPTEIGSDTFEKGFPEMDSAIEGCHGKDHGLAAIAHEGKDQEAPEEEFDGDEIDAVGDLIEQFPGKCVGGMLIDEKDAVHFGIGLEEIGPGNGQRQQWQHTGQQDKIGQGIEAFETQAGHRSFIAAPFPEQAHYEQYERTFNGPVGHHITVLVPGNGQALCKKSGEPVEGHFCREDGRCSQEQDVEEIPGLNRCRLKNELDKPGATENKSKEEEEPGEAAWVRCDLHDPVFYPNGIINSDQQRCKQADKDKSREMDGAKIGL